MITNFTPPPPTSLPYPEKLVGRQGNFTCRQSFCCPLQVSVLVQRWPSSSSHCETFLEGLTSGRPLGTCVFWGIIFQNLMMSTCVPCNKKKQFCIIIIIIIIITIIIIIIIEEKDVFILSQQGVEQRKNSEYL